MGKPRWRDAGGAFVSCQHNSQQRTKVNTMSFMITPEFVKTNSTFIENVLEHLFIHDVSRTILLRHGVVLNIMRSEIDAFGFDLVLSSEKRTVYLQMKTRSNSITSSPYSVAEALWKRDNSFVVWMLYNSSKLVPISYYCLDCSAKYFDTFEVSKKRKKEAGERLGRRDVRIRDANHKSISLEELLDILFPDALD